jgi:hypothetical protein
MTEYALAASGVVFVMVIIAPGQWIANACAFLISMIYLMHQVYSIYDILPVPLVAASCFSVIYFTFGSRVLYQKFRKIYKVLFDNQKLVTEMRRVLELFPESVIIRSLDCISKLSNYYTNDKFNDTIINLKDLIADHKHKEIMDSLESLAVNVTNYDDTDSSNSNVFITANEFLKQRESVVVGSQIVSSTCKIFHDRDDTANFKILTVKTLKVNWEENPDSYLHVFIDTTDIYKLEQANNDIRCQKIMFASASHEFRTPLNAILNSFELIKLSFLGGDGGSIHT